MVCAIRELLHEGVVDSIDIAVKHVELMDLYFLSETRVFFTASSQWLLMFHLSFYHKRNKDYLPCRTTTVHLKNFVGLLKKAKEVLQTFGL